MTKTIQKVFIGLCLILVSGISFSSASASVLNPLFTTNVSLILRSITGGFTGTLDSKSEFASGMILSTTDFVPNFIIVDIYDGGNEALSWYMGVVNKTTDKVITPDLYYQSGTTKMIIILNRVSKGDEIIFYMRATSGKGNIDLRATLDYNKTN